MQGMSWGGLSTGSWNREDLLMAGTSPYAYQSPSFHSASYLPKMEANYMRNYLCCDIQLDSMHELLQHYEEAHAAQPAPNAAQAQRDATAARSFDVANALHYDRPQLHAPSPLQHPYQPQSYNHAVPHPSAANQYGEQSHDHISTFDNLDDMDMDESAPPPQRQQRFQPQPQFGRQQPRGPAVNVNLANAFQGHSLNSATPTTPHAHQQGYSSNLTVSAVNTPALGGQTSMSRQTSTPDSSMPGTPAEFEVDYGGHFGHLHLDSNGNVDSSQINASKPGGSGTIDDPAKRLLSRQGHGHRSTPSPNTANGSDVGKRGKDHHSPNGASGRNGTVTNDEAKPFKCPVIGCEKAYKNQNGLKYHKQHGHQSQQLKENTDGTFSIVDPATSIPYPGTVGMEKEKPYQCDTCGKRYKNLNGLKYHRQHSPHCNPDFKLNSPAVPGALSNAQGMNANVAGGGLGMDMTGF